MNLILTNSWLLPSAAFSRNGDCFGNLCVCVCVCVCILWVHKNFRIICSSSVKNVLGILIGIALNL